jgi:hypothetical protein
VRAREDLRLDLNRARHRLLKLLLRHGLRFEAGKNWTVRHRQWLSQVGLDEPAAQATLYDYLGAVDALVVRRGALEGAIEELVPSSPWADEVARLRSMRGVNTLTAIGLCAEVGDWARFPRPAQVMSYLGLVPSEQSSGEQRRQGTITKSGSQHGRRLLVEAAWHYRRDPTSAHRCGAARPDNPPTSSRSRGRGSGAAIAPGSACTPSAERTPPWSTSPSRASLPASAGPSPPPTNPRRHPHGGRGGGPRQHHAPGHPRSRYGQPPQAATPDPRQRALRRNPVLGPPIPE